MSRRPFQPTPPAGIRNSVCRRRGRPRKPRSPPAPECWPAPVVVYDTLGVSCLRQCDRESHAECREAPKRGAPGGLLFRCVAVPHYCPLLCVNRNLLDCAAGIAGAATVYSSCRWFIPFGCIPVPRLSPVLEGCLGVGRPDCFDSVFTSRWAKNCAACRCATADGSARPRDGDATANGWRIRSTRHHACRGRRRREDRFWHWSRPPDRRRRHHAWYLHQSGYIVILVDSASRLRQAALKGRGSPIIEPLRLGRCRDPDVRRRDRRTRSQHHAGPDEQRAYSPSRATGNIRGVWRLGTPEDQMSSDIRNGVGTKVTWMNTDTVFHNNGGRGVRQITAVRRRSPRRGAAMTEEVEDEIREDGVCRCRRLGDRHADAVLTFSVRRDRPPLHVADQLSAGLP